jgi:hypothetical protein
MSPLLIVSSFVVLTACGAVYCLVTGLNPLRPRRWYHRGMAPDRRGASLYLLLLFLFGDS